MKENILAILFIIVVILGIFTAGYRMAEMKYEKVSLTPEASASL